MLAVKVTDASGLPCRVDFFSGSTQLGTGLPVRDRDDDGDGPNAGSAGANVYFMVWNRVSAGSHAVRAELRYSGKCRRYLGAGACCRATRVVVVTREGRRIPPLRLSS